jgi:CheY-like chemotaxis protein
VILLVEDDPSAREGYAEFLEHGGFQVAQAGSAEHAVEITPSVQPDVIVTDIALPGKDGFALASALRDQPITRTTPILAMTAYWATDVRDRAEQAGITAILLKPCQPEHLIAELHRVLQRRESASRTLATPVNHPKQPPL